jgi:dihydrofolate reductase
MLTLLTSMMTGTCFYLTKKNIIYNQLLMGKGKAKLIYSMLMSLDGYTEDKNGKFGWGAPDDEEVHAYVNKMSASTHTFLYGRRMYETMVFWETALNEPNLPKVAVDYARQWQEAQKIVFSTTLNEPKSARTRIEHAFDPDAIRKLKANSNHDISVDGPSLASQALMAGLIDEFHLIICPVLVGGGKRFFPDGVNGDLELKEDHRFRNGVMILKYGTRSK